MNNDSVRARIFFHVRLVLIERQLTDDDHNPLSGAPLERLLKLQGMAIHDPRFQWCIFVHRINFCEVNIIMTVNKKIVPKVMRR